MHEHAGSEHPPVSMKRIEHRRAFDASAGVGSAPRASSAPRQAASAPGSLRRQRWAQAALRARAWPPQAAAAAVRPAFRPEPARPRLLLRSGQLGLQIGKLGIAQLEQALGFGELAFELAHAALQRIDFGGIAGGRSGARSRVTRRHQAQAAGSRLARSRRPSAPARRRTSPLASDGRHRGDFFAAREFAARNPRAADSCRLRRRRHCHGR